MRATSLILTSVVCVAVAATAPADETALEADAVAAAFGAAPIWGIQLSPDGERLSQMQMHPSGISLASVADFATGTATPIVTGTHDSRGPRDVMWCGWASHTRLVCGLRLLGNRMPNLARLVAVDSDGGNLKSLDDGDAQTYTEFRRGGRRTVPYKVIDWLPDDPDRVLVMGSGSVGYVVAHLDVDSGAVTNEVSGPSRTMDWITDGHGEPRLYRRLHDEELWYVRDTPSSGWSLLHAKALTDTENAFTPVGFGERRNELLVFDRHEGRRALFALDLENKRSRRLISAHASLDVTGVHSFGKYKPFVAATYIDDRLRFEFFDERLKKIHAAVQAGFVGKDVSIIDEDWNKRYYLLLVDGAEDPGTYYRFDSERNELLALLQAYPLLAGRELAPVRAVTYPAGDGTRIPAYLTLPKSEAKGPLPAVVLLHDGPSTRDYLRFDFLAQYLAASGYAVLQSNFRGSAGYGDEWAGQGGYRDWRRAIGDIADGTEYLAREGIANPDRICIAGWGYGGYAALMSVIENASLYRCVVSIAGITDPRTHGAVERPYTGGRAQRAFIGRDDDVLESGSPLERADEIDAPALFFHGQYDGQVLAKQSDDLAKALQRAGKDAQFVEYEYAEHDIRPERDRIDLLTRLAAFLGEHLAK